jgi:electron transfer flavoprotein-quinone oxidoreductase
MMERYDAAIIGGGTAGLAALKRLADHGKQAILIEAGKQVGTKNVSGGILYSKIPKQGRANNVEDLYENFTKEAPVERKITRYILHAASKDRDYAIDLTKAHEYRANFGYSVLLGRLNP